MKFLKQAEGKQQSLQTERDVQSTVREMLDRISGDGKQIGSIIVDVIESCEF